MNIQVIICMQDALSARCRTLNNKCKLHCCLTYTNTQIHKYTDTQIHRYANTQIHKYKDTKNVIVV